MAETVDSAPAGAIEPVRKDTTDLEIAAERACIALWTIIECGWLDGHQSTPVEALRASSGTALQMVHWTLEELRRATGWERPRV